MTDSFRSALMSVCEAIDGMGNEIIEAVQQAVRIPSVNPTVAPDDPGRGEGRCAEFLADLAGRYGLMVDHWAPAEGRANVAAWLPGDDSRSLLLGGHLDTVPAGDAAAWSHGGPYSGARVNERIWGLGSCDMKAGVVASFFAAAALRRAGIQLTGRLIAHGVVGEESGEYALGTLGLVSRGYRPSGAVIAEPTGGMGPCTLAIASVGWLFLKIELAGLATHVGLRGQMRRLGAAGDAVGVNAVEKAHDIVSHLLELEQEWNQTKRHDLFEECDFVIHPGVVHAGPTGIDNPAIVADRATLWYSVLYPPNQSAEEIKREIEDYLRSCWQRDSWLCSHPPIVTWPLDWPPAALPPQSPLVRVCTSAMTVLQEMEGWEDGPRVAGAQVVTDASWLLGEGIPALVHGPGEASRAHAVDESVAVEEIIRACKVYAVMALRWCGIQKRNAGGIIEEVRA